METATVTAASPAPPATEADTDPRWFRERRGLATHYRGMSLTADEYGFVVLGRFAGYSATVQRQQYGSNRPSIDENCAAATAAADDVLARGWEPLR